MRDSGGLNTPCSHAPAMRGYEGSVAGSIPALGCVKNTLSARRWLAGILYLPTLQLCYTVNVYVTPDSSAFIKVVSIPP